MAQSGFALMIVLFYANARTTLIDPSVADIEPWLAVGVSASSCSRPAGSSTTSSAARSPGRELLLAAAVLALVVLAVLGDERAVQPPGGVAAGRARCSARRWRATSSS